MWICRWRRSGHPATGRRRGARPCEEAAEEGAVLVVVGLPVNMDGSEGPAARRARDFARALGQSPKSAYLALRLAEAEQRAGVSAGRLGGA